MGHKTVRLGVIFSSSIGAFFSTVFEGMISGIANRSFERAGTSVERSIDLIVGKCGVLYNSNMSTIPATSAAATSSTLSS